MSPDKKRSNFLQFALIFALVYLGSQLLMRMFFPAQFEAGNPSVPIVLKPTASYFTTGHHPVLSAENTLDKDIALKDRCPMPPVDVYLVRSPSASGETLESLMTTETVLPCTPLTVLPANTKTTIDLAPWKYSLFSKGAVYEVRLPVDPKTLPVSGTGVSMTAPITARFSIQEPGFIVQSFRAFITKPFLNFLIFIASILPGHNLGIAIIVLTVLVKLLLFFPTQKAMEGQKEMQKLQPKLNALKEKYKGDNEALQRETMKLWKEHRVNPLQSCLPTLIQFPILIGLFYTIRDGSTLALSRHLIYAPYQHLNWAFGTHFLGLDLLKPDIWVMPALLVILQFLQMKLAFAITKRKKEQASEGKKVETSSAESMQQNVMLYGMPLLIGVFAFKFPAAVSLYWGISTLFGIAQQIVVNRRTN